MPGGAAPVPCRGRAAEAIGYKLEREEPAPQQPGFGGLAFNRRHPAAAPAEPWRTKTPTEEDAQVDRLAAAFQKDMRPVGEELLKLLETPEGDLKAACNALAKRLPKMIPASTAMADALEEEMARAVAGEVKVEEEPEELELFGNRTTPILNEQSRGKTTPESTPGSFAPKGGGGKDVSLPENKGEKRRRECREALAAYKASNDHPSADDVANGSVDIQTALKKGFEAEFGGQKVIFFTSKLKDHYDNPNREEVGRFALVRAAVQERTKLMPGGHHGGQVVLMGQKRLAPTEKKLVVIADEETGIAVSVMKAQQNYCDGHFKHWRRK